MPKLRPMLAASFDDPQTCEAELIYLRYPILGSPKIDGIRWMKPPFGEKIKSRSWTDLPNQRFQEFMSNMMVFDYLDGEVIVGDDPTKIGLFNETQSAIMTRDDDRCFSVWVFDHWRDPETSFIHRTEAAETLVHTLRRQGLLKVNYVEHKALRSPEEVLAYEQEALEAGYEGVILRDPQGIYKFGRSTLKQQGMIKMKRFSDDEAQIIGFEALERNTNPQTKDHFGLAKRSHHKAGKIADQLLGKLLVRSERFGEFAIGSGFDIDTRTQIWFDQASYLGKVVTFKYQAHGSKDKPRTPIFKGMRAE